MRKEKLDCVKETAAILTMKDMPFSEKPYEILEEKGPAALSDAQLLAILLRSGSVGERSIDLSARLLAEGAKICDQPLQGLCQMSLSTLRRFRGVGRVKSLEIQALLELSRRLNISSGIKKVLLDGPEKIAEYYMERFQLYKKEVALCVYLNKKYERISEMEVGRGALDFTFINQRDLFLSGFERGAYAFVLLHNHPSGDPTPSQRDRELTLRLIHAGHLMEMMMMDHIVLGEDRYYSFKEQENIF